MTSGSVEETKASEGQPLSGRVRFGIRGKLYGAFAGVASLTLLASVVAFFSYSFISAGLYRFETEGVSAITQAQALERRALELTAISSSLIDSRDDAALAVAVGNLKNKQNELEITLNGLRGAHTGDDVMASLKTSVDKFEENADLLAASIANHLAATKKRKALEDGALAANRALREALAPIVDDAGFDLMSGLESLAQDHGHDGQPHSSPNVSARQAADLQALADLRAEANRVIGILTEVSLTPRIDQLPPLRDQFAASVDRSREAAAGLSDTEISHRLSDALEKLLSFGADGDGVFDARHDELTLSLEAAHLVAAGQERQIALAADVGRVVDRVMSRTTLDVASSRAAIINSQSLLVVLIATSVLLAASLAWIYVGHGLLRRLAELGDAILALAAGDLNVAIPHEGADELSRMATAVEVFKQHAIQARELEIDKERGRIADLRRREASFRLLFESNPVPMWLFDQKSLHFLSANDAAIAHYGYSREQFLAMTVVKVIAPSDRERFAEKAGGGAVLGEQHWRHVKANGAEIDVVVYSQELEYEGAAAALAANIDVTERKLAEARVAHMAHHDPLTDLANRVLFRERLSAALARAERTNSNVAVLCVDLDRFKEVNDTLGHPVGDALLAAVAERLRACVRSSDTVSRFGGDEFAIVQDCVSDPKEVSALAARLLERLNRPYRIEGHDVVVSASIGVAVAPTDASNGDALLKSADIALYRAKADGRSNFRFFEAAMDTRLQSRRDLEIALRNALNNNELELHYQPLVDLHTNEVTGFEALLRWSHPERGHIPPGEFIPIAEESGLIGTLGEWVLHEACAEAATWPTDLTVAINLSPIQFATGNLVAIVINALGSTGLAARRLELEITESVLLQENEHNLSTLRQLHDIGARISLDDFGTGYSSLSYLRSFPFDKIKIDRSFVNEISENTDCRTIVRAIAELASGLRMVTTAEGVESADQLERVRAEGCTEAQGFIFSQPMQGSKIREFLAEHRRLYGASVERWSSFRNLLIEAGLEKAAREFMDDPIEPRRAAAG
jgi:diguanylate cyclase (GGDEF)-like protein/PAS domain S-box-containing protein